MDSMTKIKELEERIEQYLLGITAAQNEITQIRRANGEKHKHENNLRAFALSDVLDQAIILRVSNEIIDLWNADLQQKLGVVTPRNDFPVLLAGPGSSLSSVLLAPYNAEIKDILEYELDALTKGNFIAVLDINTDNKGNIEYHEVTNVNAPITD
jgi:hypothetical protein